MGLYQDYSDILIVYKKTKFMQDLYSDIKSYVQKVKIILTAELETLQSQDVVFIEGDDNKMICPVYQKRLKDIIQLLLLIVCTQNQPQQNKDNTDVLRLRNQMVSNFRSIYHKIKVRQLRALLGDIQSYKM